VFTGEKVIVGVKVTVGVKVGVIVAVGEGVGVGVFIMSVLVGAAPAVPVLGNGVMGVFPHPARRNNGIEYNKTIIVLFRNIIPSFSNNQE
jgi:hypothetical protein